VSPVDNAVKKDLSLPTGGDLLWDSGLNVTLNLTAKTDSTALIGEIAGVLRVNDTDHLNWVSPPPHLISGQIYVVWMSTALRWNSSAGLLEFSLPNQEANVSLLRREADGTWISVPGTWNRSTHILAYSPTDLHLMNGTFAIVYDEAENHTLTVTRTGNGTVTSSPAGIDCGSDCTQDYNEGTVITLTASPDSSWTFTGWGGACTGTEDCLVTMDSDKSVSATFTYIDTVYVAPDGQCNGNNPCYSTIQEAIASEYDGVTIKIAQGDYDEDLVLGSDKDLRFEGGWDSEFTTQSSYTVVNSIMISNGTVAVDRLVVQ